MAAKSVRQVILRQCHPSRVGYVLNGEWVDALATAVEEFVAEHYVEKSSTVDGCPTCGGRWTANGKTAGCNDAWHVDNYPHGRRIGY